MDVKVIIRFSKIMILGVTCTEMLWFGDFRSSSIGSIRSIREDWSARLASGIPGGRTGCTAIAKAILGPIMNK